ncbi:hypothetical protein RMATCC62417_00080 [Rhizopus microsporus]|nr:hypothetical protein RMATCC62417_00080 [Rhizopus microsporus]
MWYSKEYDPIQAGSIDGHGTVPHDNAIKRAMNTHYKPPQHLKTDANCTLFVGRLSFDTVESTLQDYFSQFGDIVNVTIIRNNVTGLSEGYGFVTFRSESDTRQAYRQANRARIDDHTILVDYERSRLMKHWVPRRLGGGFGGRKESGQLRFGGRDRPFREVGNVPSDYKRSGHWKYSYRHRAKDRPRDQ